MSYRVVVLGDVLLDIDVLGSAHRLAPDAPAPVVDVAREVARPGGAGLAAALAASDGAEVVLVAPLGHDADADRLCSVLPTSVRLVRLPTGATTAVKRRIRVSGQTLLRLDSGPGGPIADELPGEVAGLLADADAVLVSDYGRGLTSQPVIRELLAGLPQQIPIVWDPHPRGAAPVPGVRVATPNVAEAVLMAGISGGTGDLASATQAAAKLVVSWRCAAVAVTLGPRGALLSYGEGAPTVVPADRVVEGDTCGAGDRFASRLTTLLGQGQVTVEAVAGATGAATEFVADGGAAAFAQVPADAGRLDVVARVRAAGGTVVATGGCFDLLHAGHVASLRSARSLGDCLVVCVNSDASVRRLKGPTRPLVPVADRVQVLEALSCVDAVLVFDEDSPAELLDRLRPDLWVKGGDYAGVELPEQAVLRSWGGQAVVLPYLEGRSTTGLVRAMSELLREETT
ncbi:MAG: D-beta-D-heptose 7-phosphate kinase / D-beta-D-heptose 1-phosphate adenosyltransferase [Frankiales bacterium]|nr:D-beta-D-heptose 7-phosphate kinase / D-beta-D-heptose 1-phosphate adenosyltransferase [Frankiales bacterium]